jgi:hypothetical protein
MRYDAISYDSDTYLARRYTLAREAFATRKSNRNAATLLRCAMNAESSDLINDDELAGVICDVIDYLEQR